MGIKCRLSPFILTPSKEDLLQLIRIQNFNLGYNDEMDGEFLKYEIKK